MKELTGRSAMRSPGAPSLRREVERDFWRQVAKGLTSEDAAVAVGASQAAGSRWFRERGGMASLDLAPLSGRYLSFGEREEIALLRAQNVGVSQIAGRLGRHRSTISRELRRNAATRGGRLDYRASVAQWKAELLAQRPKPAKLVMNARLHAYVQQRLAGQVRARTGLLSRARSRSGRRAGTSRGAETGGGSPRGVRSRSPTGWSSTSPMMGPCGSRMRRSTRPSTSRVAVRSSVNWWPAYGPDVHCGSPPLEPVDVPAAT